MCPIQDSDFKVEFGKFEPDHHTFLSIYSVAYILNFCNCGSNNKSSVSQAEYT